MTKYSLLMTNSQKQLTVLNIQVDKSSAKNILYQEIEKIRTANPDVKIDAIINEDSALLIKNTVIYGWLWNGYLRENYGAIEIVPVKSSFTSEREEPKPQLKAALNNVSPRDSYNQMLVELSKRIKYIKIDNNLPQDHGDTWTNK